MRVEWPLLVDERERLHALRALEVLGGRREERFDRITRMATRSMSVPISLVSLLDEDVEWVKSGIGLDIDRAPRSESFCAHAIVDPGPFVVVDAAADARFREFSVVTGPPHVRSYAAQPLTVAGRRVGALCVMDTRPRAYGEDELAALIDLGHWAETELRARDSQRVAQQLDLLQRRTEMVLEGVAEGIVGIDRDGVITFANGSAADLLGWPVHELVGKDLHGTLHTGHGGHESHPAMRCPVRDTLEKRRNHRLLRENFWRRDGAAVPVDWSTGAVGDEDEVLGAVVVFEDVTRRVEVERAKDEFVSVVSHELRTPLTALRGSLGLLLAGLLGEQAGPEARRLVEMAHSNALRLGRLVDDILDLDRSTRGDLPLVRRPVEVSQLMHSAVATVQGAAVAADVELAVSQGTAVGTVWVDEYRLIQALTNLLGNAIRFAPPGSTVRLQGDGDDAGVRLSVIDEGPGIPEQAHARIFERFWQVDAGDSRARGGSGLGLAIAKNIVEAHGGCILLDSRVGEGSTFTVSVPRRADQLAVDVERRRSSRGAR